MSTPMVRLREYIIAANSSLSDVLVRVRMTSSTYADIRRDGARETVFDLETNAERMRGGHMSTLLGVELWISPNVEHHYIAPVWRSDGMADMFTAWRPTRLVPLRGEEPLDATPPYRGERPSRWDRLNSDDD